MHTVISWKVKSHAYWRKVCIKCAYVYIYIYINKIKYAYTHFNFYLIQVFKLLWDSEEAVVSRAFTDQYVRRLSDPPFHTVRNKGKQCIYNLERCIPNGSAGKESACRAGDAGD